MKKKRQIVGVLGLLVNHENKFLITLRNDPQSKRNHLKWEIPGGKIEHGEDPINTLARELQEEIGVRVEPLQLLPGIGSILWEDEGSMAHILLLCYLCRIKEGTIHLDRKEAIDFRWIRSEELTMLPFLPFTDTFIHLAEDFLSKK